MYDAITQFLIASAAICGADRQKFTEEKHDLTIAYTNVRHIVQSLLNTTAVDIGETVALF